MAQTLSREGPPSVWLALIIAALVLIAAAIGYVAFNRITASAPATDDVRLEAPRLPSPPNLPDAPRLPKG